MELDDWDFSAEVLDSLERDALKQIAERKSSSFTTTSSDTTGSSYRQQQHSSYSQPSPAKPLHSKVAASPSAARVLPTSLEPTVIHNDIKEPRKVHVKLFVHSSGSLAAKFQYNEAIVSAFRQIPKASWNGKEKLWMFPYSSLTSVEQKLCEIRGLNVEVEGVDSFVRRAITSASAVPDLRDRYSKIPSSLESLLLPFQRDGVRFVLQHGGRALIADEMGLGKTIQAIALASCFSDYWPVLVLTPSSLRLQWASMIQQWLSIASSDIHVLLSQWGGSNRSGFTIVQSNRKDSINLDGLFNIISYDVVSKLPDILLSKEFKVVIADESHFLKNEQAQRTKYSLPILQKAQCAILLSGTPALSRPKELFKQLEALHPDVYRSIHEYGNRYCMGGKFGMYQGSSNLDELHNLLKSTVMIRRLKNEVLSELPVKRRQQVFLEVAEKDMKQINALFRELEVVKGKIKACQSEEEVKSLKFSEKHLINKIYTDSAEAKIPAVLDYLGTILEAGCKFIIFAHHLSMIDSIYRFLHEKKKVGCIRIDGSTPAASRQALVTEFQEKEAVKAAVLSIKAGGVGLTLTAASTVIFAELSWTPGDMIQAEDRAHRIGQVSSVNVYYLLANDTVDDIIWDVVQSKLENLGQVLDGHEKKMDVTSCHPIRSPAKQKTLDSYMKRCNNISNSDENQPKLKMPRQ